MKTRFGRSFAGMTIAAWVVAYGVVVSVQALPPVVKTVPWVASNELIPHSTYAGRTVTLKGTCDQTGFD